MQKQRNEVGVYLRIMPKKRSSSRPNAKVIKRAKPVATVRKRAMVVMPKGYTELLAALKERIRAAQLRAALAVNHELVALYWHIGKEIIERQGVQGWGTKVVDRIAKDLHREFPDMGGLSERNLNYMRNFAAAYPEPSILQQPVAKLPWGHIALLLTKVKKPEHRLWYA